MLWYTFLSLHLCTITIIILCIKAIFNRTFIFKSVELPRAASDTIFDTTGPLFNCLRYRYQTCYQGFDCNPQSYLRLFSYLWNSHKNECIKIPMADKTMGI